MPTSPPDLWDWLSQNGWVPLAPLAALVSLLLPRARLLLGGVALLLLPLTLGAVYALPPRNVHWGQTLEGVGRGWLLSYLWSVGLGLGCYLITLRLVLPQFPRWFSLVLLPVGLSLLLTQGVLATLNWNDSFGRLGLLMMVTIPIWLITLRNPRSDRP